MSSSEADTTSSRPGQSARRELLFIDSTSKDDFTPSGKRIRSQAARAGSNARLATMRRRVEERPRPPGQQVFAVKLQDVEEPLPRVAVEQHRRAVTRYRDQAASVTVHSHNLLGGSIPAGQADAAILGQFLNRFKSGPSTERPWIELVMAEAVSSATPTIVSTALQANASALCANDMQAPEIRQYATKLYLSTIRQVQSLLRSPRWRESVVMHTCMILSLYECIESNNPAATRAHVSGVAYLIQQKGPQCFAHGLEHRTFRYYRINILMMCLGERRSCFLAEPDWKTIPFSGDCPPKTVLDAFLDVLAEIPGVLAAVDTMRKAGLHRYALVQKAFELAFWVRRLIYDLERWKENYIWTYPAICTVPRLKTLDIVALCETSTGMSPYDVKLGEALNCYAAAHLILTRIAGPLAERSLILRTILRPPYSLRDLVAAIVLVSQKHMVAVNTGMMSLMVMAFPLKVAQSTTELNEPALFKTVQELLDQVNEQFSRRYNIKYSVSRKGGTEDA